MISFDTAATIVLVLILTILVVVNRHKLSFQRGLGIFFIGMYRTQFGLKAMDKIANAFRPFWIRAAPWMIAIGFIGMGVVTFDLIYGLLKILTTTNAPTVGVVLPVKAKGVFYVPFIYWILSIFIILIVHEGAHGVMARVFGLPVKNSGLLVAGALVPLVPGAFVEPDEKKLAKAKPKEQLAVYAAGPFANIALAAIVLLIGSFISPITEGFYSDDGIVINSLMADDSPAALAGLLPGEKITTINGEQINTPEEFSTQFAEKQPGDMVNIITTKAIYDVQLGENPTNEKAWLGVYVEKELIESTPYVQTMLWIQQFLFWLFILNLGVGLFNLVPLGPIDGGRMLLTGMQYFMHENKAMQIWKTVSLCVLGILLTNLVVAFV